MRILVLSNTPFLPPTAGNRARIGRMLGYLGEAGAEIAMLMLPEVDRPTWDDAGMHGALAHFAVLQPPLLARARRRLAGADAEQPGPVALDAWCPPWFRRAAARFAATWRPDAVLVEYVFLSACLDDVRRAAPAALRIIDTHDVMHRRADVYARLGLAPRWFHTTAAEERRGLARADVILAIHEHDAQVLRELVPERTVLVVPHGHAIEPTPLAAAEAARLLLVASYNDANVEGLRWLAERVWPRIVSAAPGVELSVCGTIHEKVGELPAGIVLRGPVAVLHDEYARARLVLNPVPGTTGVQVKTVEALCHGRPVVSTTDGATGLAGCGGVVTADGPEAFAAAVLSLLADDDRWRRTAGEAVAYARRHFAPEVAFAPLLARLREMSGTSQ